MRCYCHLSFLSRTSSEKEYYHGQDNLKSSAPFFNQSNCIIHGLIQSEMEPQTSRPSAIFKTMCAATLGSHSNCRECLGINKSDLTRHNYTAMTMAYLCAQLYLQVIQGEAGEPLIYRPAPLTLFPPLPR